MLRAVTAGRVYRRLFSLLPLHGNANDGLIAHIFGRLALFQNLPAPAGEIVNLSLFVLFFVLRGFNDSRSGDKIQLLLALEAVFAGTGHSL